MARPWQGQNIGVSWLEGGGGSTLNGGQEAGQRSLYFSPNSCILSCRKSRVIQDCQSEVTTSLWSWRKGHPAAVNTGQRHDPGVGLT